MDAPVELFQNYWEMWGVGEMRHQNPPKCTSLLSLKEVPGVRNVLARDIHESLQNLFWVTSTLKFTAPNFDCTGQHLFQVVSKAFHGSRNLFSDSKV